MTDPALTTVSRPHADLGAVAFHSLISKIKEEPVENVFLQHALVKRQSV